MRLCDGVMLAEPGRSGREQSVSVALKVWRYAARRSGPMRADCEAKRSEPTRGNTVPGGLAKFPRQIGEVPPAARRGPPRQLDEVPPAGRRGPAGGCPAKCVCPALVANGRTGAFANDTATFGSAAWHERIVTATYGSEAKRSGPRLAARRSESNRNHTNRATIWPQRNDTRPRLARSATIRATSGVCGCPVSLMGSVPALLVPRDGEHTKDRDRRSTTSVNGP